ncbi:DUF2461 domain-containing protein [Candidatus Falkowbacteria bacterium]|nr:DUF2461 domain-containing protein [Candidatus Falkowbacteria bacterium]
MENILSFLSDLKANNNRDWFNANKERYLRLKALHVEFLDKVIHGVAASDSDIQLITAADCTFRIYRDVRFSKNKDPYKTNVGALIRRGGRKSDYAGYYLHLEPGATFAGGGQYMPAPELLRAIRYEIYNSPQDFQDILSDPVFVKNFGTLREDKLKRPPKDFPADAPMIEHLKYKSFTVGRSFTDEQVMNDAFLFEVIVTFEAIQPLLRFLNQSVGFSS